MPEQKKNAKKPDLSKTLRSWWRDLFGADLSAALQGWKKTGDIARNNFNTGMHHLRQGNLSDAIMRFKLVVWLEPGNAEAWYQLGCAYVQSGKNDLAVKALRKSQQIRPQSEETNYMIAIAAGAKIPEAQLPKMMPRSLALTYFDGLAPEFTEDQLEVYGYRGHILLCEAVKAAVTPGRIDHVILDLGVGTGLCGPLLRDIAASITGVDMSSPMLAEAMKVKDADGNKIYDSLIHRDIEDFLANSYESAYDIVLAAGVVSFIGGLDALYVQVARVLKPGGLFALTADKMEGLEYRFDPAAARFRFSSHYLGSLAEANGLSVVRLEEVAAYPDIRTWLCVFAKKA